MTQIEHPDYYRANGYEAADFIEAFNLNFNLGNVIKYVTRAGRKNNEEAITALLKAQTYLLREISRIGHEPENIEQLKAHQQEIMKGMRPAIYDPEHYPEDREL